ncbi:MAG: PAS domain-containing protein [Janthinobacterium lividum]
MPAADDQDLFTTNNIPEVYPDSITVNTLPSTHQDNFYAVKEVPDGEDRFRNLLLQAPVAIAIFTGYNFVIELANEKVLEYWGRTAEQVINIPLFTALPEASGQGFEQRLQHVLQTGEPYIANELPVTLFRNGKLGTTWINFVYDPIKDSAGTITGIMVVCTEVTDQVNSRKELEKITDTLNQAIESAEIGTWSVNLATDALILSEQSRIIHGILPEINPTLSDAICLIVPEQQQYVAGTIKDAVAAITSFECEYLISPPDGAPQRWVKATGKVYADNDGNALQVSGTILDITKQKAIYQQKDESLQRSNDLLQSAFDTGLIGMSVMQAVRNEQGEMEDFTILLVNKQLQQETGRTDLVGKLYSQEYPGIRLNGLLETMFRVVASGRPEQMEYHYVFEGFNNWYSSMFVKLGDGLVATNLDITIRKLAEQETLKNLTMLQQAELVATLGSWEFELETGIFTWSDGMYRLFDIEKNTPVVPEIFQQFAVPHNQDIALRIVNFIRRGCIPFEETLEILSGKNSKIIKITGTIITDSNELPKRLFGVNMDITSQIKLQEAKKQMEAEQNQQIFRITLDTQEEERKRIAENLHNTLGQLLFGVRISISQLSLEKIATNQEDLIQAKQYAEHLLSNAIKECRRISHELTPTILQDFGLQEAIMDIGTQFGEAMPITFAFTRMNKILSKYLQTTIYRTVQELVMNIIKHAQATQASIEIAANLTAVDLTVKDNGIGFNPDQQNNGIGLKMIQSKIKLLNGSFNITSNNGRGNVITLSIPYGQD